MVGRRDRCADGRTCGVIGDDGCILPTAESQVYQVDLDFRVENNLVPEMIRPDAVGGERPVVEVWALT